MKLEVLRCHPEHPTAPPSAERSIAPHPPILFLHGAYCGGWIWSRFLSYFCDKGYDCHAPSLRGHGGSEGELRWASLADYIEDLAAAVDGLAEPPVLVGHSLGGLVIQHLLARQHLRAAVLLASVPPSGLSSSMMHLTMGAPDVLWQLGMLQTLGPNAVTPEAMHRAFLSPATPPDKAASLLAGLQAESSRVSAELFAPSQPRLPAGPMPILVLGGSADLLLPVSAFRETATYFHADLEILDGAPHGLMLDEAWWQPTADTILGWLEKQGL